LYLTGQARLTRIASFDFDAAEEKRHPSHAPFVLKISSLIPFIKIEAIEFMLKMFAEEIELWTNEFIPVV
jgi:hypothetical protein